MFGGHTFPCDSITSSFLIKGNPLPESVVLVLSCRGLHFVAADTRVRLYSLPFEKILRWTGTFELLNVVIDAEACATLSREKHVDGNEKDEIVFSCRCQRSVLFRQLMLEIIHTLMTSMKKVRKCVS